MTSKKNGSPTAAEFIKLAKTKWGRRWRLKAAEALSVHPTTVWRWVQDGCAPPKVALIALRAIAGVDDRTAAA